VGLDTSAGGYAVFGRITAGADVITAARSAPCVSWSGFTFSGECVHSPNLTITAAIQTR
jgi:hypothetical protein